MTFHEFERFREVMEPLFDLSTSPGRATELRELLGIQLREGLRRHPAGKIADKQARFVAAALEITGTPYHSAVPGKIINNLSLSQQGDKRVAVALLFLCCKITHFAGLQAALIKILKAEGIEPASILPKVDRSLVSAIEDEEQPARSALAVELREPQFKEPFGALVTTPNEDLPEQERGRRFLEKEALLYLASFPAFRVHGLAILDVDGMTKIVKHHSLAVGDEALKVIERVLHDEVQGPNARIGRCGADAFYVLLPGCDAGSTGQLVAKVRHRIAAHDWSGIVPDLWVRVSIGYVTSIPREGPLEFALRAAMGMRNAKRAGGDTVMAGPDRLERRNPFSPVNTREAWS